jgi:lytic murein transglycosylase
MVVANSRDDNEVRGMIASFGVARFFAAGLVLAFVTLIFAAPASAATCGGSYENFLAQMRTDAQAAGVSAQTINMAFAGLSPDQTVLAFDRRQHGMFHSQSFEQYASTRVIAPRINRAKKLLVQYADLFSRIEAKFGVPREMIMAIWTMETDNGTGDMGKLPVIRTLSSLAWDCRRTDLFQGELIAALKILQRGDLPMSDLIGAYAGEIGQTQFLPSSYIKYGVDFDGDGRVDLRHDVADVLASTANLLHTNGFKMGQPYGEGSANFEAMHEWNHALIYRKTIAYFANQLVGR